MDDVDLIDVEIVYTDNEQEHDYKPLDIFIANEGPSNGVKALTVTVD